MFPRKPLKRASVSEEKMLTHQNGERDIKFLSACRPMEAVLAPQTCKVHGL